MTPKTEKPAQPAMSADKAYDLQARIDSEYAQRETEATNTAFRYLFVANGGATIAGLAFIGAVARTATLNAVIVGLQDVLQVIVAVVGLFAVGTAAALLATVGSFWQAGIELKRRRHPGSSAKIAPKRLQAAKFLKTTGIWLAACIFVCGLAMLAYNTLSKSNLTIWFGF